MKRRTFGAGSMTPGRSELLIDPAVARSLGLQIPSALLDCAEEAIRLG
jgi:hypothetical protein